MTRKIASHFYLSNEGIFIPYPIITVVDGLITKIETFTNLPEIAGLEFYSGIILPVFTDFLFNPSLEMLQQHSSWTSLLVSKIGVYIKSKNEHDTVLLLDKCIEVSTRLTLDYSGELDYLPILDRIEKMVQAAVFESQLTGIVFFTATTSDFLNCTNTSRITVGAKGEFIHCADLSLLKSGCADKMRFLRLK